MTQPEILKRWLLGPPGWTMEVCTVDARPGGAYRFEWRGPGDAKMGLGGVHREVMPGERIVNTQLFDEDWTGGEVVGTLALTEHDGRTTLTNTMLYPSATARDAVLKSGMTEGMRAGYDRLADLLKGPAAGVA